MTDVSGSYILALYDVSGDEAGRRVAGMSPDGEQVRLGGRGCTVVRPRPDGAWRIAADAWRVGPEPPAEDWLSHWPDAGTRIRSD